MVNQCICFFIKRNQKGWVKSLPLICFNLMNTVNKSTGFSPFQLWMGRTPQMLPPLIKKRSTSDAAATSASQIIEKIHLDTLEEKDCLKRAKISQAVQANKARGLTFLFKVGNHVRLSTFHRRREFKAAGQDRVAEFMPRFDGPFRILETNEAASTVKLELPPDSKTHPNFRTSQILPYCEAHGSCGLGIA
jgi:hypothetical protein